MLSSSRAVSCAKSTAAKHYLRIQAVRQQHTLTSFSSFCWKSSNHNPLQRPLQQQPTRIAACYYSSTPACWKKKDDDDDDEGIVTLHTDMTDEEAAQLIEAELQRMQQEEDDKYAVKPEDWKPGMRKRKLVVGRDLEEFEREIFPERFQPKWTLRNKRCGALAIKVGMMPVWDPVWGERFPTTVLFVDSNVVLGHKTMDRHGYWAAQVAAGQRKRKNVGKCVLGQYKPLLQYDPTENPPYLLREFRVTDPDLLPPLYSRIHARHFVPGQNVDVSGISKGKGFQGGMKLHNFGGMPASHGTSRSHRSLGSTGQCQDPGKVFKGKKMAGRMGSDRITVQNLRVVKIDRGRNLIYVKGHVPGNKGSFVEIRDAVKKPLWNTDLVEGKLDRPPLPTYDYSQDLLQDDDGDEAIIDGSGKAGYEVFMPIGTEDPLDPDYRNTLTQLKADE